ncbi:MAG: ABC transporter substrate-binding protein [Planctomycetota bacterium]
MAAKPAMIWNRSPSKASVNRDIGALRRPWAGLCALSVVDGIALLPILEHSSIGPAAIESGCMSTVARMLLALVSSCIGLVAQSYTLSCDPWVAWAPAWVAQEKGMWKRHGIDVQVISFSGCDAAHALTAGKVDFCMAMAGTAVGLAVEDGADVVVLGEIDWSHGGDKLVVDKGLDVVALRGKRVGIYEDSPAVYMFLAEALQAAGLGLDSVQVVVIEDPESLASQIVAHRLAGVVLYDPFVASALKQGARVVATTADYPGVMPEVVVAARQSIAKMPPTHVTALLRGWIDAVEWCQRPENEAEFLRIAKAKAFGDEEVEVADVRRMLDDVRIHDRATLKARNLGEQGIAAFLARCEQFARRHTPEPKPAKGPLFSPQWMRLALGEVEPEVLPSPGK